MKLALLALLVLAQDGAAPQKPAPSAPIDPLAQLAPRAKIAGLDGFQSSSTVVFDSDPTLPHLLEATYVFPGRARWSFAPHDAQPGERQLVYRCGRALYELAPMQTASNEIDAEKNAELYAQNCWALELRRALFLWPDGFAWSAAPEVGDKLAETDCGVKLRARVGGDGRPTALFVDGFEGVRETFREITWREQNGRWWPAALELHLEGQRIWKERVEALNTNVNVLDLYFVPADRRVKSPATRLQHVDMSACSRVRIALAEGADWNAAASAWTEAVQRWSKPDSPYWPIAPGSWVELDANGKPRAVLVAFTPTAERKAPEGIVEFAEQNALRLGLSGAEVDFAAALTTLRGALPQGANAGTPFARFPGTPGPGGPTEVVLPLVRSR
jgi:hypothetical protein